MHQYSLHKDLVCMKQRYQTAYSNERQTNQLVKKFVICVEQLLNK